MKARSTWPVWTVPASALMALILFTIVFEIATKGESILIKPENLLNILRQVSFVGIIAMGMTLVITLGGIDLSVGSLVAFLGGVGILFLNRLMAGNSSEWVSVLMSFGLMIVAGTLAGVVTGLLVSKGRLAPFIATLGGLAAYRSLAMALVAGGEYRADGTGLFGRIGAGGIPITGTNIAPNAPAPVPLLFTWPVLIFAVVWFVAYMIMSITLLC